MTDESTDRSASRKQVLSTAGRLVALLLFAAVLPIGPASAQRAKKKMPAVPIGSPGDWVTPDDYPPDAIRAEREGRVVAEVGIDSAGKPVSCSVSQTSGTTSLDQKTCELALARGRFDPATDGKGRPTAGLYRLPVRWVLPETVRDGAGLQVVDITGKGTSFDVEQTIGTDGTIEACRIIARSDDLPDLCAQVPIGTRGRVRFVAHGDPVRAVVRTRNSRTIQPVKASE